MARVTARELQTRLSVLLQAEYKDYEIAQVCDAFGMPEVENAWTHNSKRVYVSNRLAGVRLPEMLLIARRVLEEVEDAELEALVGGAAGVRGVDGTLKNLIFATVGAKPRIVLRDAINNTIEIVEGAERCLVYDRPLQSSGLTRSELLDWWTGQSSAAEGSDPQTTLSKRLGASLESCAEKVVARAYGARATSASTPGEVPALIPQVYLHYDPYTSKELRTFGGDVLVRQRMDFLLLLEDRRRVVIEVDGKHHYAEGDRASPRLYSEMVAEDRRVRLDGYEVFRFGGYELTQRPDAEELVTQFFDDLLA